jgi:glutathione synthase
VDEFNQQLLKILDTVDEENVSKETCLCIFRSDYMLESRPEKCHSMTRMKQIEVNTIACASGCISQRIPQLHKYVISLRDGVKEDNYEHEMPTQFTGEGLAEGLATAWKQYGSDSAVIVMLINSAEKNVFDMYHLDACLWLNHGIKLVHFMFDDVIEGAQHEAKLHKNGALFVGGYEAAVIYFRTAYSPAHYLSQKVSYMQLLFHFQYYIINVYVALGCSFDV